MAAVVVFLVVVVAGVGVVVVVAVDAGAPTGAAAGIVLHPPSYVSCYSCC